MQEQFNEKAMKQFNSNEFQFGQTELGVYVKGGGDVHGKLVRHWRQTGRSSSQRDMCRA